MQTRAAVAHKAGEPLTIETVELDGPQAGIVAHLAICHRYVEVYTDHGCLASEVAKIGNCSE